MCADGFSSIVSSIALRRTLAVGDFGQPPPKRFDPQTEQKVFAVPSSGRKMRSESSATTIRIDSRLARPFVVPTPPESFLQLAQ